MLCGWVQAVVAYKYNWYAIQLMNPFFSSFKNLDAKAIRENIEHWMHKLKTLAPFDINALDGSNHSRHCPNIPRQRHRHPHPHPSTQGSQDPQNPQSV